MFYYVNFLGMRTKNQSEIIRGDLCALLDKVIDF